MAFKVLDQTRSCNFYFFLMIDALCLCNFPDTKQHTWDLHRNEMSGKGSNSPKALDIISI